MAAGSECSQCVAAPREPPNQSARRLALRSVPEPARSARACRQSAAGCRGTSSLPRPAARRYRSAAAARHRRARAVGPLPERPARARSASDPTSRRALAAARLRGVSAAGDLREVPVAAYRRVSARTPASGGGVGSAGLIAGAISLSLRSPWPVAAPTGGASVGCSFIGWGGFSPSNGGSPAPGTGAGTAAGPCRRKGSGVPAPPPAGGGEFHRGEWRQGATITAGSRRFLSVFRRFRLLARLFAGLFFVAVLLLVGLFLFSLFFVQFILVCEVRPFGLRIQRDRRNAPGRRQRRHGTGSSRRRQFGNGRRRPVRRRQGQAGAGDAPHPAGGSVRGARFTFPSGSGVTLLCLPCSPSCPAARCTVGTSGAVATPVGTGTGGAPPRSLLDGMLASGGSTGGVGFSFFFPVALSGWSSASPL